MSVPEPVTAYSHESSSTYKQDDIYLSLKGGKGLVASKNLLVRESTFFRHLFDLGEDSISEDKLRDDVQAICTIPLDIDASSMIMLYDWMGNTTADRVFREGRRVPARLDDLSLSDLVNLLQTADFFDCERVHSDVLAILKASACTSPMQLLRASSDANLLVPAKLAIAQLSFCPTWPLHRNGQAPRLNSWFTGISGLRHSSQSELTRLCWVDTCQVPDDPTPRPRSQTPYERQDIMLQSGKSYSQIAEDFNPL